MTITAKEKKDLKAKAHHLNPVVMLGDKGLTDSVNVEIDRALNDHELIKVKIAGAEREARRALAQEIASKHQADVVQEIGNIVVLYRKGEE